MRQGRGWHWHPAWPSLGQSEARQAVPSKALHMAEALHMCKALHMASQSPVLARQMLVPGLALHKVRQRAAAGPAKPCTKQGYAEVSAQPRPAPAQQVVPIQALSRRTLHETRETVVPCEAKPLTERGRQWCQAWMSPMQGPKFSGVEGAGSSKERQRR